MDATAGPSASRPVRMFAFTLAVVGVLIGLQRLLTTDDLLSDVTAYYDAGARLNAGQALYAQSAGADDTSFYRYPPLLAIVFRPLALLPYPVAAVAWEAAILVAFVLTVRRLGPGFWTWIWLGILAMPIVWSVTIGQAQVLVTALLTLGSPWAVALAGHLKLFPFLVGLYWIGRRDWGALARFVGWSVGLGLVQLVLEPNGTIAFLSFPDLGQVGEPLHNWSLYGVSPTAWVAFLVIGAAVTLLAARTRWGWATAVTYSVFASPRILSYQLMTLLAGLRPPTETVAAPPQEANQ